MGKKILIVDDEDGIREILTLNLGEEGYEVITASDGLRGLELARQQKPALIVLDVMLPRLDGYQVCHLLKFDSLYAHIPIIMISARDNQVDIQESRIHRADAYLTKPFNPEQLFKEIKR